MTYCLTAPEARDVTEIVGHIRVAHDEQTPAGREKTRLQRRSVSPPGDLDDSRPRRDGTLP